MSFDISGLLSIAR